MERSPADDAGSALVGVPADVVSPTTTALSVDDEMDSSPFFEYLQSPQGHEIVCKVVSIVDDFKKAALRHNSGQVRLDQILQVTIVIAVVVAASALAILDKFSTAVGILFGTLVGYVFGKKTS